MTIEQGVIEKERAEQVRLVCAFCGGTGKDPFGIMSRLSTCYVCRGEKYLRFSKPLQDCHYCQGTGISPTGGRNSCLVCSGTGAVSIKEPSDTCAACGGSGRDQTTGFYCWSCRGKGLITIEVGGALV